MDEAKHAFKLILDYVINFSSLHLYNCQHRKALKFIYDDEIQYKQNPQMLGSRMVIENAYVMFCFCMVLKPTSNK